MGILLCGATVVDPAGGLEERADVWIRDGRIAGIGERPGNGEWERLDVSGLVVCPGLIDLHVHLRTPGQEHKENIYTGTRAAVAGGFTSVCCMPNTSPPIDRPARVAELLERIHAEALCRVFVIGAVTKEHGEKEPADVGGMVTAGCVAVTDDAFPLQDGGLMAGALVAGAEAGVPVVAHCEDRTYSGDGVMNLGAVSAELGLPGQDSASEEMSLRAWNEAAAGEAAGRAHLHVAHVSSAGLLREVERLRIRGSHLGRTTLETAPHYLALTEEAVRELGANAKMNPPLRTEQDRQAIRAAVRSESIDAIATDHAPHTPEEKAAGMPDAPFGIVGLETALGVMMTEFVYTREMTLPSVLALMTHGPASVFDLGRLGQLSVGAPADLTIIDPRRRWVVEPSSFRSKGRNSPFAGRELRGRAWGTIVGGRVVMREYEILERV